MGEDVREQMVTFIGGGLVIGGTARRLPEQYCLGVDDVFERMKDEDWQQWWENTGLPPLELWSWIGGGLQGPRIRRTQFKITARLERDHRDPDPDPGRAAGTEDARELIQSLVKRFSLPEPPDPTAPRVPVDPTLPPRRPVDRRAEQVPADKAPPRVLTSVDLWAEHDSQEASIFAARCSPIFELYSQGLAAGSPLRAWSSWARVMVGLDPAQVAPVHFTSRPSGRGGDFEAIHVRIPDGLLDAPRETWAAQYLTWLHGIMTELAVLRHYDRAVLDAVRDHCVDQGLRLRLESPVKRSPDRQHTAQLTYEIDDEGDRLVDLVIRDRSGDTVGSSTTRTGAFFCTPRDFRALVRSLRWTSPTSLEAWPDGGRGPYRMVADVGRTRHGSLLQGKPVFRSAWRSDLPDIPVSDL